jgi:large subunit ribosomal protein L22
MTEDKTKKEEAKEKQPKLGKKEIPKVNPEKAHFASVSVKNLPISTKQSVEIAKYLMGRQLNKSKLFLQNVIDKKSAVPFKRYNRDVGHKPGKIAAGRYPEKSAKHFLMLLNSLEANAENKGLDVDNLKLSEVIANKGPGQWHYGRLRRRKMKRTHLEIKAVEIEK